MIVLERLRNELSENIDEGVRLSTKRFFKETVTVYGIKTKLVSELSKNYYKEINSLDKKEIFRTL
jgi:3-methyladenine DNA glycosylase AlkD